MSLRLELRLSQKLIMTPQLQQAIKLLQLSRLELQQTLTQHLMENPLLEDVPTETDDDEATGSDEGEAESKTSSESSEKDSSGDAPSEGKESPEELSATSWEDYLDGDRRAGDTEYPSGAQDEFPSYEQTVAKPTSLEDHLGWQLTLSTLSDQEKAIGRMIIGNLDDDGYLRTSLEEIASDTGVSVAEVESVLRHVQSFDPAGVGARDLTECLLIQLGHLDGEPIGRPSRASGRLRGSRQQGR